MRILLVSTYDYWKQDHVWLSQQAFKILKSKYKSVDISIVPFFNLSSQYIDQAFSYRGFSVNQADKVITFGPFAHLIEHNNKISFITSHMKEYYELWQSPFGELLNDSTNNLKHKINNIDTSCLSEAKNVLCFYHKIKNRHPEICINKTDFPKVEFNNVKSNSSDTNENFILCLGDYTHQSYFHLIIDSLSKLPNLKIKFVMAGRPQRIDICDSLKKMIETNNLKDTVELVTIKEKTQQQDLIDKAKLVIDCGIENDTYPLYLLDSIKSKKPFCLFSNSGLAASDFFANEDLNIITPTKELTSYFLEKLLKDSLKIEDYFKDKFQSYEKHYNSNWEEIFQ